MRYFKVFLRIIVLAIAVLTTSQLATAQTAVPMLINYQGELRDPTTGDLLEGTYNIVFRIYNHLTDTGPTGLLWTGTYTAVTVEGGICSVILGSGAGNELDPSVFDEPDRWLEIQVETEVLTPRQRMTSAAYSIISEDSRLLDGKPASDFAGVSHTHSGDQITSGTVAEPRIDPAIARDSEVATEISTAIDAHTGIQDAHHPKTTSFTELTDTATDAQIPDDITINYAATAGDADFLDGVDSSGFAPATHHHDGLYWRLVGNAGTSGANFLGTTDSQALEFRVNNAEALRLEPASVPNIIGGCSANSVITGARGATISGGGDPSFPNFVNGDYGAVGGGAHNRAGEAGIAAYATVGGGEFNLALADHATVGGGHWGRVEGEGGTVAGGIDNVALGNRATIAGGQGNRASSAYGTTAGGYSNSVTDDYGTIGGGGSNQAGDANDDPANATYATVSGGYYNTASHEYATIGGGRENTANAAYASIGGGWDNDVAADYGAIAGGGRSDPADPATSNRVTDDYGTIGGGGNNQAGSADVTSKNATYATVSGGRGNTASDDYAAIGGGEQNTASASYATVPGGHHNLAAGSYDAIGGGWGNRTEGGGVTVGGGRENHAHRLYATIGGGFGNEVTATALCGTVAGGGRWDLQDPTTANRVTDRYCTVGGGTMNQAGIDNANPLDGLAATVCGGMENTASVAFSVVSGGCGNTASGEDATVGGGEGNTASGEDATVGGGQGNTASGEDATVGGGQRNTAGGEDATVGGGQWNTASGDQSTVPGGARNAAEGHYSFAAGYRAKIAPRHDGTFLFADGVGAVFNSAAANEFAVRCTGGARLVSAIDGAGNPTAGVQLAAGGGSWSTLSDRELKHNFALSHRKEVLARLMAVPIRTWNYKAQDSSIGHMGPTAQDFYAAFGLGEDDKHISTVDADGVAFAAIQGLHEIVQEKEARISTLEKQNAELQERVSSLERLVEKLVEKVGGGE